MNDHDTTHDDIRDLLDSTAPTSPDVPPGERAAAVATRGRAARRRNRLVLASSVVLVAGVAIGVPLAVRGGDTRTQVASVGSDTAGHSSSPTTAPPPEPAACPAQAVDTDEVGSVTSIPTGATSARMCPATYDPTMPAPPLGDLPREPLVDGVEEFVEMLSALPPYETEPECAYTDYAPAPWALQIAYPDGSTVTIGTSLRACSAVEVDGVPRSAELIVKRFTRAVGRS